MDVQNLNDEKPHDRFLLADPSRLLSGINKFLRGLYTAYGLIVFTLLFAIFFPLFLIPINFKKQFKLIGILNRWWARLMYTLIAIPFTVEARAKLDPAQQYIFSPNHTSYLDIPTLGLCPHNAIFVGKNDMERIPAFGYMYRKLHITVDRAKLRSRYTSLLQARTALEEGKSLVIYPEGGIMSKNIPTMAPFKDGAFRLAIEKQIPIVPVTIPFNWIILPDKEFLLHWHPLKVIFHEPLQTKGMTMDDLDSLKEKVFTIIQKELTKHNNR